MICKERDSTRRAQRRFAASVTAIAITSITIGGLLAYAAFACLRFVLSFFKVVPG